MTCHRLSGFSRSSVSLEGCPVKCLIRLKLGHLQCVAVCMCILPNKTTRLFPAMMRTNVKSNLRGMISSFLTRYSRCLTNTKLDTASPKLVSPPRKQSTISDLSSIEWVHRITNCNPQIQRETPTQYDLCDSVLIEYNTE